MGLTLRCPICKEKKVTILAEEVRLTGQMGFKPYVSSKLRLIRCDTCGHLMYFDKGTKLAKTIGRDPDQ